jgi:NAD(P)H-dependent FMN reductase
MATQIQVVGISGSLRDGSYTRMALNVALQGAAEMGATTRLIDLREYELVFCDGNQDESAYPPDVFRLREEVKAAQGILLGTPEYHASLSGVLKNALDLMGFQEFEGKMVGLIGVSGGATGAINALNSLRTIGRSLHAWVIPGQVSVPQAWDAFDASGSAKDSRLADRLMGVGREVARYATLHAAGDDPKFLESWQNAPENPGAER